MSKGTEVLTTDSQPEAAADWNADETLLEGDLSWAGFDLTPSGLDFYPNLDHREKKLSLFAWKPGSPGLKWGLALNDQLLNSSQSDTREAMDTLIANMRGIKFDACVEFGKGPAAQEKTVVSEKDALPSPYDLPQFAQSVRARGSTSWVADRSKLVVVDFAKPSKPRRVGVIELHGECSHLALDGNLLVAAEKGGMEVLDVSKPAAPKPVGWLATPGEALRVEVQGGFAYAIDSMHIFRAYDLADPHAPREAGRIEIPPRLMGGEPRPLRGLALQPDRAVVADGGLYVLDISNASAPRLVWRARMPEDESGDEAGWMQYFRPKYLASVGRTVLCSQGPREYDELWSLNFASTTAPVPLNEPHLIGIPTYAAPWVFEFWCNSGSGGGWCGLGWDNPLNASDPGGDYDQVVDVRDVAVVGDLALLADGPNGLTIIRLKKPVDAKAN